MHRSARMRFGIIGFSTPIPDPELELPSPEKLVGGPDPEPDRLFGQLDPSLELASSERLTKTLLLCDGQGRSSSL
jgi:hypothetical protein